MTPTELVQELRGTVCRCGAKKATKQTFCRECYYALKVPARRALYNKLGSGYEEAYAAAETALDELGRPRAA